MHFCFETECLRRSQKKFPQFFRALLIAPVANPNEIAVFGRMLARVEDARIGGGTIGITAYQSDVGIVTFWIFGYIGYRLVARESEAVLELLGLSTRPAKSIRWSFRRSTIWIWP